MSRQACSDCNWSGVVRVYDLVWRRAWACPGCGHMAEEAPPARVLVSVLASRARSASDLTAARRAASLSSALDGVLARSTKVGIR